MSAPNTIQLSAAAQDLLDRLGNAAHWVPGVISRVMQRENEFTIRHIQMERMDGNNGISFPVEQHKLGVRTARLRRSLNASLPTFQGQQVTSTIGTNVEYAAAHEFGMTDTVIVPAHTRRRYRTVRVERIDSLGRRRTSRKRVQGDEFAVKSYSMKMNLPARAPITTGVNERMPALGEAMSTAIVAGFAERGLA